MRHNTFSEENMSKATIKIAACAVIGAMVIDTAGVPVAASVTAGVSAYTSNILASSALPTAGVSLAFSQCMTSTEQTAILASAQPGVVTNDTPVVASEYSLGDDEAQEEVVKEAVLAFDDYTNIAVAQVSSSLMIRSAANEDAEVLGKIYNNCIATVLGEEDGWYYITSGSVTGYAKADYLTVGDVDLIKSVCRRVATVTTASLRVREEPNTDSSVLTQIPEDDDLTVLDESLDGWISVSVEEGVGYVSNEYVTLSTEYEDAESK
jgi:uncharacterized protein YgiM (DUF1202 family)